MIHSGGCILPQKDCIPSLLYSCSLQISLFSSNSTVNECMREGEWETEQMERWTFHPDWFKLLGRTDWTQTQRWRVTWGLVHLTRTVLHTLIKPQNTGLDWSWISGGRNLESLVYIDQNYDILYIKCAKRELNTHRRDSRWTCHALWGPPHVQSASWHHKGPVLPWDNASPELTTQQKRTINLMK